MQQHFKSKCQTLTHHYVPLLASLPQRSSLRGTIDRSHPPPSACISNTVFGIVTFETSRKARTETWVIHSGLKDTMRACWKAMAFVLPLGVTLIYRREGSAWRIIRRARRRVDGET